MMVSYWLVSNSGDVYTECGLEKHLPVKVYSIKLLHYREAKRLVNVRTILQTTEYSPYTAVECGNLDSPTNGRVDLTGTVVDSTATYSCFPGFVLANGDKIRECGGDKKWSGTAPVCVHWSSNTI